MIDLKQQYGGTYKIALDESADLPDQSKEDRLWLYQIPCKTGHIGVWGENLLSAYCNRSITIKKLLLIEGVVVKQRGDREITVVFPPEILDEVATVLKAKKRRRLSEAHKAKLQEASAPYRFNAPDHGSNDQE